MEQKFPILLVDDDIVSRTVVEKYLRKAGFEVAPAANGRQALTLFDEKFFPIVLTDWMMPEIDGAQLCRLIREKKTDGYVFIVLITAKDTKSDIVIGLEAGADDYIAKPIHQAELIARIKTGIRILRLEQSLKQANEEIRLLSITDPLTGCFNRGHLNQRFNEELSRAQRYSRPLSVALADIDHFKRVNDTYGHQAGDDVLKLFAQCIRDTVRKKIDWVVRYGGEEFLIVLPETGCEGARHVAERLRKAVENLQIAAGNSTLSITASFGATCLTMPKEGKTKNVTMESLINEADELLYRSKREGRNCVSVKAVENESS
jgi:two-component system cell cycle response regulator